MTERTGHTADALALELRTGVRFTLGDGQARDALTIDDMRAMAIDRENLLLDVGGGVSLASAAAFAREHGYAFPIGDTVPDVALSDACFTMPAFADAFVAHAELVTQDGLRLSTPRAPRSATGPDLIGLALVDPPLAVVVRARIRVFSLDVARPREELHATPLDVAMRLRELMHEGRAFVVEALRHRVRVLGPAAAHARAVADRSAFPVVTHARTVVPSEDAIVGALVDGARVVVSPYLGRAAVFDTRARVATFERRAADVDHWRVSAPSVRS